MESKADVAALSGGVVAVSVSVFVAPGPYDLMSLIVGVTMLILLVSYIADYRRFRHQSFAAAAVLSLIFLLPAGFMIEVAKFRNDPMLDFASKIRYALGSEDWSCKKDKCDVRMEPESSVELWELGLSWLIAVPLFYQLDKRQQKRLRARQDVVPPLLLHENGPRNMIGPGVLLGLLLSLMFTATRRQRRLGRTSDSDSAGPTA